MSDKRDRKFTDTELDDAVDDLETIPFFRDSMRASVKRELMNIAPHYRALRWLVDTAKHKCKEWPGMSELRGLLCTRFDPADGIDEPMCSISGYSPYEQEQKYLDRVAEIKHAPLADSSREFLKQLTSGVKGIR